MLAKVVRFMIIVTVTLAWLLFSLDKSRWVMFAGLVTIIGIAELTGHFTRRKES